MKVGDKFSSYEEFNSVLALYKQSVNNEFWIRDARTITNQRKRAPESVLNINESLKYYHLRLACVKGGRVFKSKNENSKRKCTTYKEDCEATIFVRVSDCKQFLCVLEVKDTHNHASTKTYFTSVSQHRLQLPDSAKERKSKTVLDKKIELADFERSKNFEQCVNVLKNTYHCSDVQLLAGEDGVVKGLFFQDTRMKKYFEAFPELLFIDGTCYLGDLKTATYIIMIQDGCGLSEIVAVCLLVDEEQSLNYFMETFKTQNPAWDKVQVVMSDKSKTERLIFKKHLPDARLIICLSYVLQIFNKKIKKMGISVDEMKVSKDYFHKLASALTETDYEKNYDEMVAKVPTIVKEYYDSHWGCITEHWVEYLTLQNLCFDNKTNGLETVTGKLKSVINTYSPLEEDYIKHLFAYVNSVRVEKDVKSTQLLNRKLAKPYEKNSVQFLYLEHLTTFAFEKVEMQLNDNVFLAGKVTPLSCDCLFRKCTQLPCGHIFNCRSELSLPLFDPDLCSNRWSRSYCANILEEFVINGGGNKIGRDLGTENSKNCPLVKHNLTKYAKFKLMDDQGKKMAQLCSGVPTKVFRERLKVIQTIIKHWEEGQDEILTDIFKDNFRESETSVQIKVEDTSDVNQVPIFESLWFTADEVNETWGEHEIIDFVKSEICEQEEASDDIQPTSELPDKIKKRNCPKYNDNVIGNKRKK